MVNLDWVHVADMIARHWIEQLGVLSVGVVTWLYNKKVKKYMKDQKSIRMAMLA